MIVYEKPAEYRGTIEVYPVFPKGHGLELPDSLWAWKCKSRNGQPLANGGGYKRRAGALNAIDAQYSVKMPWGWNAVPYKPVLVIPAKTVIVMPWRLVIRDRHGNIEYTGAVY